MIKTLKLDSILFLPYIFLRSLSHFISKRNIWQKGSKKREKTDSPSVNRDKFTNTISSEQVVFFA